ncbi:hypothetical protein CG723_19405 [Streptomyces sp. CB01635]|uniref:hypothetical protein n=1 Tax=unclassified Streptomyces TaxID=2593676 RepID=UPI000C26E5F8|nr:hypothetical protein [Streptomyces sp. CB01635]PJN09910.1 hypothetical protein CG723_19405 [Streptomyces sp. CB01635]
MADEHNKWLDRDAAERLLRGEPLEAVDAATRARAARLAETLDALAVTRVEGGELRGEAAALAAFRKARESVAEEPGAAPLKARHARPRGALAPVSSLHGPVGRESDANANAGADGHAAADVGSVRLARPDARPVRWGRPVRFGLAAAFAGCMIGGVAVAAGTGVLPSPFGGRNEPGPAASVSAAASPEQPLASPSPDISETDGGRSGSAVPDGHSHEPGSGAPSQDDTADRAGPATTRPGTGLRESDAADREAWRQRLVDACRKYRDGALSDSQTERLRAAAKRIATKKRDRDPDRFCARILEEADDSGSGDDGSGQDGDDKNGGKNGDEDSQNGEDSGVSGAVPTASWVPSEPGGDASDTAPTTPSTTASASYSAAPAQS